MTDQPLIALETVADGGFAETEVVAGGTPEEFAAAAAFLVSERASYITGQSLAVDGGWIKGL